MSGAGTVYAPVHPHPPAAPAGRRYPAARSGPFLAGRSQLLIERGLFGAQRLDLPGQSGLAGCQRFNLPGQRRLPAMAPPGCRHHHPPPRLAGRACFAARERCPGCCDSLVFACDICRSGPRALQGLHPNHRRGHYLCRLLCRISAMRSRRMFFHICPCSHCRPGDWVGMNSLAPRMFSAGMSYRCMSQAHRRAADSICAGSGIALLKLPATATLMDSRDPGLRQVHHLVVGVRLLDLTVSIDEVLVQDRSPASLVGGRNPVRTDAGIHRRVAEDQVLDLIERPVLQATRIAGQLLDDVCDRQAGQLDRPAASDRKAIYLGLQTGDRLLQLVDLLAGQAQADLTGEDIPPSPRAASPGSPARCRRLYTRRRSGSR